MVPLGFGRAPSDYNTDTVPTKLILHQNGTAQQGEKVIARFA